MEPLPAGSLVLLVGPPAAGKSTLAAAMVEQGWLAAADVLSSDTYREALTGDPSDLRRDRRVFSALRLALGERMRDGRTTVVDATNLYTTRRRRHVEVARANGRAVVAVLVDTDLTELLARNEGRPRRVPPSALVSMARQMRAAVTPDRLRAEGVDVVLTGDEVRASLAAPPTAEVCASHGA